MEPGDPRRLEIIQQARLIGRRPPRNAISGRGSLPTRSAPACRPAKCPTAKSGSRPCWKRPTGDSDQTLAAYVKIRLLTAAYAQAISAPKANVPEVQAKWTKDLEQFIADYPAQPDAAEAMLQLGIAREYGGQDDEAKKWYRADRPRFRRLAASQKGGRRRPPSRFGRRRLDLQRAGPQRPDDRPGQLSRQGRADPVLGNLVYARQERHGGAQAARRQVRPLFRGDRRERGRQRQGPQGVPRARIPCRGSRFSRKAARTARPPMHWASSPCPPWSSSMPKARSSTATFRRAKSKPS